MSTSDLDIVTQSEVQTFCDCRVKHHFAYEQLLKPKRANITFHLGNVVHKWLEHYYLNGMAASHSLLAISNSLLPTAGSFGLEDTQELESTLNSLQGIAEIYPTVDPVIRYKLEVLKVEYQFLVQDPNVPRRKLSGKIDLLCRDKSGRLWIMDHKTVSRIDQKFANGFRGNRQMQIYLMGGRLDQNIRALGKLGGVIPNLIRKPQLRRKQTEGAEEFLARVRQDITDRKAEYFLSDMIPYEEKFNRETELEVFPLIKEMRKPIKERLMYKNPSQCESYLGKCAFHDICYGVPGHESLYTKKSARHEELIVVSQASAQPPQKAVVASPSVELTKRPEPTVAKPAVQETKTTGLAALVSNLRGKKRKGK